MTTRTEVAAEFGLANVAAIEAAAKQAGLPFPVACALMEKESGGRNIYGHDAGGAGPHGQPVTEANYRRFITAVLNGATSNGVGPAQITYAGSLVNGRRDGGFFTAMKSRGLRPWVPVDNMRFGFELLAGYFDDLGGWVAAGERYNGARSYGQDLARKISEWRKRLAAATPDNDVDELDILSWNPHKGNPWRNVARILNAELELGRPDLIALHEVTDKHDEIAAWAVAHGYDHLQETPRPRQDGQPVPEHGSTAVLVNKRRPDLDLISARVVVMRLPWTVFSHQQRHEPRRYWVLRLETFGGRWRGRFSHWPTNGFTGGNRVAFAESATRAATWLRAKPGIPSFDEGDHNELLARMRAWARTIAAKIVGHRVDHIVTTGPVDSEVDVKPKHDSDHHLMRYRLTRKPARRQ